MKYYDIHTHHSSDDPDTTSIINTIVSETEPADLPAVRYRSYGIHPWYINNNVEQQFQLLEHCLQRPDCIALGEAGLDKPAAAPMDLQQNVFKQQTLLAEKKRLPLIIHCVKAWQELLVIKKEISPRMPWIIHGFRGNGELAKQLINQGFYLSLGTKHNPAALQAAWPDRILTETDETEINIREVYGRIAASLSLPETMVAEKLAENSNEIFGFFK